MFHKSRRKIVTAIMTILVLLYLGTLAVIYISSYADVSASAYKMLKDYTAEYSLSGYISTDRNDNSQPKPAAPTKKKPAGRPDMPENHRYKVSIFYSVAIAPDGEILAVDLENQEIYEEETLKAYAIDIWSMGKEKGTKGNLVYLVTAKKNYTLVTMMDNTIMQESISTLFKYTLIFGSIAIVALFFVASYLAKRIVKPLEESYQKQKQFISDAGHELKTPISVISANAEILAREIGNNQWLTNIQYENERMGKLVTQLLELARTENVTVQKEQLDFGRLVESGALPLESIAFEKGLTLSVDVQSGVNVVGNSSQLSQLVSILIDNAISHGQNGKEVDVRLTQNHNYAVLSIVNTAEPISQEKMEQLFERFYRSDEVRNGEDKHYGLGLAIAKAIVTAHKGKIEVKCYEGLIEFCAIIPKT